MQGSEIKTRKRRSRLQKASYLFDADGVADVSINA